MRESVVITGIGVVSAAGLGRRAFDTSLKNSVSGLRQATLNVDDEILPLMLGAVDDALLPAGIEPRRHLNFKHMSRSGLMVCAAADMAAKDAAFQADDQTRERTGILMGTAFGGVQSMLKFNSDVRLKGPGAVNPIIFPDTVSNAPAGYAAISFGLMGMNATLSSGFSSGLTAIRIAYEQVASGILAAAFAGGYDELIPHLCKFWQDSGELSSSNTDNGARSIPFDEMRNGFHAGEGAVIVLLEKKSIAQERGATIYGELLGFGSCQANGGCHTESRKKAMMLALKDAGVKASNVAAVFSSANGSRKGDLEEGSAIEALFGTDIPVTAIKAFTGENMGASGPSSVAAALWTLGTGCVPGVPKVRVDKREIRIKTSPTTSPAPTRRYCLINAFGPDAEGESLVLGGVDNN